MSTTHVSEKTLLESQPESASIPQHQEIEPVGKSQVRLIARGELLPSDDVLEKEIKGYDAALMSARAVLSSDEEKKLLRRIDWRLLPLLAIMYMIKTIDAANLSNARIMDEGTSWNILTELHMTSNQYNMVTTAYYVIRGTRNIFLFPTISETDNPHFQDPLHRGRDSCQHGRQVLQAIRLAGQSDD